MKAPFFIELLARNGDVLQRHRIEAMPVRIGRAYDNDVLLDDPYVAAHHATIVQEDGQLIIHAEASHNGIVSNRQRLASLALDGDTAIRLGHTRLRVRAADHPVAAEMLDSTNHHWEGWPPAFAGLGLMVLVALLSNFFSTTTEVELTGLITASTGIVSMLLVWSGLWSLANRLFGTSPRFGRHLFIAAAGYAIGELWTLLGSILAYGFSWEFIDQYNSFFETVIMSGVVYFHLITINPRHRKRMLAIAASLVIAVSAVLMINNYRTSGALTNKLYMDIILPPAVRVSGDQSLDEFFDRAAELREALDKQRADAVKKEDAKKLEEQAEEMMSEDI